MSKALLQLPHSNLTLLHLSDYQVFRVCFCLIARLSRCLQQISMMISSTDTAKKRHGTIVSELWPADRRTICSRTLIWYKGLTLTTEAQARSFVEDYIIWRHGLSEKFVAIELRSHYCIVFTHSLRIN